MKTSVIILIILNLIIVSCRAQDATGEDSVIPILISNNHQKIVIKDKNVPDSLKISYAVIVNFEYPLKDTSKIVNVDSIHIYRLIATSLRGNKKILNYSTDRAEIPDNQKYIWDLCNDKFQYWYKNQQYETMIGRHLWDKQVVFGGTLYIIPR